MGSRKPHRTQDGRGPFLARIGQGVKQPLDEVAILVIAEQAIHPHKFVLDLDQMPANSYRKQGVKRR